MSSISVSFDSGTDGNINQVNVQNRVCLAEPQLPEEVRKSGVTVNKASNSILLVYNFVNEDPSKTEYSVETISGYLDKNLTDNVKRVKGVGDVTTSATAKSPSAFGWTPRSWPPTTSRPPMWSTSCEVRTV